MDQHHYLGFKRFAGHGVRYVFDWRGQWVGLAGWQSGAFKCRPRDQWIGWKRELQFTRMHLIANNTRFLILGAPGCFPNLASLALAAMVQRLSADWSAAYGHSLLLAETFVDPSKFCGYMYKAAGWTQLGRTKGYARANGRYTDPHGVLKDLPCIAQVISRFSHQFFDKIYLNQYVEEISEAIFESPYGCEFRLG